MARVRITLVLALLLLAAGQVAPVAAAAPPELTPREAFFLEAHGPIRHVVWLELPPTVITDEHGQVGGIDADIRALMSIRLGLEFQLVRAETLGEAIGMLERGEADTISPVSPSPGIDDRLDFTAPYVSGGIGFWVAQDHPGQGPEHLSPGDRVAAVPGAVSQGWLEANRPDLTMVEVSSIEEGIALVSQGQAEAYLGSFASVAYLLGKDPSLGDLRPLGDMVIRANGTIAVPAGHTELLSIMNKGLESISREDFTAIYTRWTGFDLSPERADPGFQMQTWHWAAVAGLSGLLVALAGATVVLRSRVEARTRELQESEHRYRQLFEEAPIGLLRADLTGTVVHVNRHLVEMLGYPSAQALMEADLGEHYVDPSQRARLAEEMEAHGSVEGFETQIQPLEGRPRWVQMNVHPVTGPEGEVAGFETSIADVTGRKRAEAQLRRHADELARSNAELERFAYVASHDLQEPIRMVHSYVQMLQRTLDGELDEASRAYLDYVVEGAERMHHLVRALLEYARVDREGAPMEPVDVGLLLDEVVATLAPTIEEAGATITHDALPTVVADRAQLGQVLQNLVGNALKFRGQDPPMVHIGAEPEEDGWHLTVEDNGIGIDPAYHDRIFEVFQRLHRREVYPGTGVGLAICRRIVEHHGGQLWVESQAGQGATFHFTLPPRPPSPTRDPQGPTTQSSGQGQAGLSR